MSRRSQVVRNTTAARSVAAPIPGSGTLIYCDGAGGGELAIEGDSAFACSIPLTVTENYHRFFMSATVWDIGATRVGGDEASVASSLHIEITDRLTGQWLRTHARNANWLGSLCLTGAVDLGVGTYDFGIRLATGDGNTTFWGGSALQVIVGQTVSEVHCPTESFGSS